MKLIRIFALSVVAFYFTQENETDALIARMIEGGANLAIDAGLKIIEIPIMIGGKIAWKSIKVSSKFIWDVAKIPFRIIIRLAWKFSRKPLKAITPKFIQNALRKELIRYKRYKQLRKQKKSRFHRFKTAFKNKINNLHSNLKKRKNKRDNKTIT